MSFSAITATCNTSFDRPPVKGALHIINKRDLLYRPSKVKVCVCMEIEDSNKPNSGAKKTCLIIWNKTKE